MGYSNPANYYKATRGELNYYFIYGENFPEILKGYRSITGTSPLLPKFATRNI
jgi:alpha-glucosidase (family GH31 glycosyl hydrolase)